MLNYADIFREIMLNALKCPFLLISLFCSAVLLAWFCKLAKKLGPVLVVCLAADYRPESQEGCLVPTQFYQDLCFDTIIMA